jgi:fluoride exporter
MNAIYVFLGGGLGSLARFAVGLFFKKMAFNFPFATLVANVLACLIFGAAFSFFQKNNATDVGRLFILTGFCGGFSTFSTFSSETMSFFQQNQPALAFLNISANLLTCLLGIWLGLRMFGG